MANPYPAAFIDQNNEGRLVGELNFTDAGNQPGGSSRSTLSFDATTDPDTFLSPVHVFDLGVGAHVVLVTLTAISLVGDGETFGNDAGTIYAGAYPQVQTNGDGSSHYKTVTALIPLTNFIVAAGDFVFELQTNTDVASSACVAGRYLRAQLGILSNDTGELYAGANHPTAHATITVTYL